MIVQVYEIQTPQEAAKCIGLGVNHIGSVILRMDDWRVPIVEETVRLTQRSGMRSIVIPLFHDRDVIRRVIVYYHPDFIHFCDSLTDDEGHPTDVETYVSFQMTLREEFPEVGIIRSIPVPREGTAPDFPSLEIARMLSDSTDMFLIDTWIKNAPEEGYIGITGELADREIARSLVNASKPPVILAGGLSPQNVYGALMAVRPAGADSCTQTNQVTEEDNPIRFQKDLRKVKQFVEEVRRAEMELSKERERIEKRLEKLRADLVDREAALPVHSVRPHQVLAIEALEDEIEALEKELDTYRHISF